MSRRSRLLAPAALALLGAWLLSGCIFLPTFDNTIRGENAARSVGGKRSSKPIRLHVATRDDVLRFLGDPAFASPDLTRIAYTWDVRNGYWVWPLCFAGYAQEGRRIILLTFDESAVLRTAEVLRSDGNFLHSRVSGHGLIPWDMLPGGRTPVSRPATGPATVEAREAQ